MRGCPYKAIPTEVYLFYTDFENQEAGFMAPYTHAEFPSKYADMGNIYRVWAGFFRKRTQERDHPRSGGLDEIAAFRAKEGRR